MKITISEDRNTIMVDGVEHQFMQRDTFNHCPSCSFYNSDIVDCLDVPCTEFERKDRKHGFYSQKTA